MSKIALVSPYSWSYPGGVTRHIEALAQQFLAAGHDVRVLAPHDPVDRVSAALHRGVMPARRALPDYVIGLGRTIGVPANGAMSNISPTPYGVATMRRELRAGRYDVVHVHEPVAPTLGWDALMSSPAPLVGTFHCFSENPVSNGIANAMGARRRLNRLRARIAVSEAAAWTGRRFFGGRYRIVPNGVDLADGERTGGVAADSDRLRIVFVGQAVERKGLPVLLRAFEALRDHVPATLQVVGARAEQVAPLVLDERDVEVLGPVSDDDKRRAIERADVLCAPSLGGESFGMVLTEAFAAGTPVVASDIAGYRDVVSHGVDGLLVPRGDASELAEALRDLWLEPRRRVEMARCAAQRAGRYAWPRVASEVLEVYAEAESVPTPAEALRRAAVRLGALPADGLPRAPARRLQRLEPEAAGPDGRRPGASLLRRIGLIGALVAGVVLAALALQRIGVAGIAQTVLSSSPAWVLVALALMCSSMLLRALSWHEILRAALPRARLKRRDAVQGTMIGVLMSATLPARLGEPSRALIVARRIGRARETLPVVIGTLVSQTLINVAALVVLGVVMVSTSTLFDAHQTALLAVAVAPLAVLVAVLATPALLGAARGDRTAGRLGSWLARARGALGRVRRGLEVFRHPRAAAAATAAQLAAWAFQWLACYVLLVALGLDQRAGVGAAAAVLFAVNVTAVVPATPSNLGIFQAACVAVLTGAYHISSVDALGYGIILQAVEVATAVVLGMPALVKEGLSWRDVRLRALAGTPISLHPRSRSRPDALEAEA